MISYIVSFFIMLFLVADYSVDIGFGTIEVAQLLALIAFPFVIKKIQLKLTRWSLVIFYFLLLLTITAFTTFYLNSNFSSITFLINLILNVNVFIVLYAIFIKAHLKNIFKMLNYVLFILAFITVLDFLLIQFGYYLFDPNEYKLGQIWSSEPNWIAVKVGFILLFMSTSLQEMPDRKNYFSITTAAFFLVAAILVINQSRTGLVLFFLSLFILLRRSEKTNLITILGILFAIPVCGLIISYLLQNDVLNIFTTANPRYYDAIWIINGLQESGRLYTGIGFGNLDELTSSMVWRENYPVVNQFWLQVLGNFGLFGLFVYVLTNIFLIVKSVPKLRMFWLLLTFVIQFICIAFSCRFSGLY